MSALHEALGVPRPDRPAILSDIKTGAWLDAQTFDPLTYHLPGIIPEGLTLLVGAPKVGKSWLSLNLALETPTGGKALGLPVEPRPTFYLALEDGDRRLQDRARKLLRGKPIPPELEYVTFIEPGTVVPKIEAWLDQYAGQSPLVILDTLGKVMPPALQGETTYSRDYRIGGTLKRLADSNPGSAIVTNHHDRKAGSEDFVDRVSGTNGLAGAADTIVVLSRDRGESVGTIHVTGRDVTEGEYAVSFDGSTGVWSLDGADLDDAAAKARQRKVTDGLDEKARSVIAYVNDHPEGVHWKDVERDLGETEARYLARLHAQGRIDRPSRGLYTPLSTVSRVSGSEGETGQTDTTDTPLQGVIE